MVVGLEVLSESVADADSQFKWDNLEIKMRTQKAVSRIEFKPSSSKRKFEKKSVTLSWPTGSPNRTKLIETKSKRREITRSRTKKTIEINTRRIAIYQTKFKIK